uniref:SANT domain-containing protein n=1 Tax=Strongyloides papillosus TaxID=174720 RepID=A0A0N5CGX7_STREA
MGPKKQISMEPGGAESKKRPVRRYRNTNSDKKRTEPLKNEGSNVTIMKEFDGKDDRIWKKWTEEEKRLLQEFTKICPVKNGRFQYKQVAKEFNILMSKMNGRSAARVQSEIKEISNRHMPKYAEILNSPEKVEEDKEVPIPTTKITEKEEEKSEKKKVIVINKIRRRIPNLRCGRDVIHKDRNEKCNVSIFDPLDFRFRL